VYGEFDGLVSRVEEIFISGGIGPRSISYGNFVFDGGLSYEI